MVHVVVECPAPYVTNLAKNESGSLGNSALEIFRGDARMFFSKFLKLHTCNIEKKSYRKLFSSKILKLVSEIFLFLRKTSLIVIQKFIHLDFFKSK